jgi:septal ring factor EnvC (AmiA/AmiB activator)
MPQRLVLLVLLAVLAAAVPLTAGAQESSLRERIDRSQQTERRLEGAAARLRRLEGAVRGEIAVVGRRLAAVEADLAAAQARLADTETRLAEQRARLSRTRQRLAVARDQLATVLAGRYTANPVRVTDLVLTSGDFGELMSRLEFLHRIAQRDATIVRDIRVARDDARRRTEILRPLVSQRRRETAAIARQRAALDRMRAGLATRQATLARVRAAREAALRATRTGRRRAQRELSKLLAERARAARATGPGGPWAIPWPIVECESGGQNLPPNSAGASGFYQFMPATWRGLGGSTPHAYLAPKAEQDRLAARLWAGGRGARNWDCAVIVGIL